MKIVIIPARGGSKRITRKNIRLFHGKPILAYPIEAAVEAKCIERVIVSTEDPEIAEIARSFGAETPFLRSNQAADDHSTLHDVAVEVINNLQLSNEHVQVIVILPTVPFVTPQKVIDFATILDDKNYDSALTVVRYEVSPFKALSISEDGVLEKASQDHLSERTQDLDDLFHDAGQMYAFYANEVLTRNSLTGVSCVPVKVERAECHDIDDLYDWSMAEMKYTLLRGK